MTNQRFETVRHLTYQQKQVFGLGHEYGDDGMRDTPVPIPNTEVKPYNADGTRRATSRETRKPLNKEDLVKRLSLFLYKEIKTGNQETVKMPKWHFDPET